MTNLYQAIHGETDHSSYLHTPGGGLGINSSIKAVIV